MQKLKTMPLLLDEWLEELVGRERPLLEKKGLRRESSLAPGLQTEAEPE